MSDLSVASIVATRKFDREFELETLGNDIDAYLSDHSTDENPGLYVNFHQNGPTVTIYTSGSFNIRRGSSEEEMDKNRSLLQCKISKLGIKESVPEFQITNIFFISELEGHINLNDIGITLGLENIESEYEPEQFPGLVYRLNQGFMLIFPSGNWFSPASQTSSMQNKRSIHCLPI